MLSPLPGPSTIVHLFVIFISGTINVSKRFFNVLMDLKDSKKRAKFFSLLIIILVFVFIFGISCYSIISGIESDKSNISIITEMLQGRLHLR